MIIYNDEKGVIVLRFHAKSPIAETSAAYKRFLHTHPDYQNTRVLDDIRQREFTRLDKNHHVYLDYTGGGLYAESQLREHMTLLRTNVLGNPHSTSPASHLATELLSRTRQRVLQFFHASPDEYLVIFTANASAAMKLLAESYPFHTGNQFLLTYDNHNSVNGIREFAYRRGASVTYVPIVHPDLRVDTTRLSQCLDTAKPKTTNLFAYPAQSNFSGVQHPLEWIREAHCHGWDVLLDAAAFAPTNALDLTIWKPDFITLSFYKMFGYPTGLGCLIARKSAVAKLTRPWYAGGTISFSSVIASHGAGTGHYLTPGVAGFEDGTVDYLSIPAIEIGLQTMESIGVSTIHSRVSCLTSWLLDQLKNLRHGNGQPMIRLYGPTTMQMRGGTIAFNVYDLAAAMWDCTIVQEFANQQKISIRSGCHCNPGAREVALGLDKKSLQACFVDKDRISYTQFLRNIEGKTTGVARISVGYPSTFADVHRFVEFLSATFRDKVAPPASTTRHDPDPPIRSEHEQARQTAAFIWRIKGANEQGTSPGG